MSEQVLALSEPFDPTNGKELPKGEIHTLVRWMGVEELRKLLNGETLIPSNKARWFIGVDAFYFYTDANGGFRKLSEDVMAFGEVTPNTFFVEFETEYELPENAADDGLYVESLISHYNSSILKPVRFCRCYDLEWRFGHESLFYENWVPHWLEPKLENIPPLLEEASYKRSRKHWAACRAENQPTIKETRKERELDRQNSRRNARSNKYAAGRWF